jgi:hypothetical protein
MSTTNTDYFSLLASLVGFGIGIYAIVTQPVHVDSTRPTETQNEPNKTASQPAFARLWDDPFAVYSEGNDAPLPKPTLPAEGDTLFLVVPTSTLQYEADRENRIRIRYAIQRALIDQGLAAEPGSLLSRLEFALPSPWVTAESPPQTTYISHSDTSYSTGPPQQLSAPVQFFIQRPLQARLFKSPNDSRFECVVVIWLPEVHAWWRTEGNRNQYLDVLINELRKSIDRWRSPPADSSKPCDSRDCWVFLGPSDSDGLAFYQKYPPYFYHDANPTTNDLIAKTDLAIVPYRATIAQSILSVLPAEGQSTPCPAEFKPLDPISELTPDAAVPVLRLGNGDDILCAQLLRAIQSAGSLPPHPQKIHVTVFAEWDTLYGRALAETFTALATHGLPAPPDDPVYYPALLQDLEKGLAAHRPPVSLTATGGKMQITVIPYLRGLDGESSLYRTSYRGTQEKNALPGSQDRQSESHQPNLIEAAEGTTQFDYIRRLTGESFTHDVPFWPQIERPDAIVIFGTDIYDKLVLLEFLRQQLRNCLYLTTDLDALYWHPHYLKFTRGLVVASAFPLQMSATLCGSTQGANAICAPVQFRDSYQSAIYMVVSRCLQQSSRRALSADAFDFTPDALLYRIGNTIPIPLFTNSNGSQSGQPFKSAYEAFLGGVGARIGGFLEPIVEGTSPFWPFVLQMSVIGLGLYSLFFDVPRRMQLSHAAADELWHAALALVPTSLRDELITLRTNRIASLWKELPLRRRPWQVAASKTIERAPVSSEQTIEKRTRLICRHYTSLLDAATTKVEVAGIALCLLSDLFSLRALARTSPPRKRPLKLLRRGHVLEWLAALFRRLAPAKTRPATAVREPEFAAEVEPFAEYLDRDLTKPNGCLSDIRPDQKWSPRGWILRVLHFLDRRLPNFAFILVGFVTISMLVAICLQPVPYLVGTAPLSWGGRVLFWLVSIAALLVTFALFHRTCYEQHRFRLLIEGLRALVPNPDLGISNRQLVVVLSKASEPVANLTIVPCALVFLIYTSHLNPLGGVAMAGELAVLLGFSLVTMLYSYTRLRAAAIAARGAVLDAYRQEQTDAARLIARLESYARGTEPLQDDEDSLVHNLEQLIVATSTTPSDAYQGIEKRIKEKSFRQGLCEYLESVIRRDKMFIQQLGEIREGVLAPVLMNPIAGALLIPIGGAGGLSVFEWIVSNAR